MTRCGNSRTSGSSSRTRTGRGRLNYCSRRCETRSGSSSSISTRRRLAKGCWRRLAEYVSSTRPAGYVSCTKLAGYVLAGYVSSIRLAGYVLAGYVSSTRLAGYVLAGYVSSTRLAGYVSSTRLAGYVSSTRRPLQYKDRLVSHSVPHVGHPVEVNWRHTVGSREGVRVQGQHYVLSDLSSGHLA